MSPALPGVLCLSLMNVVALVGDQTMWCVYNCVHDESSMECFCGDGLILDSHLTSTPYETCESSMECFCVYNWSVGSKPTN